MKVLIFLAMLIIFGGCTVRYHGTSPLPENHGTFKPTSLRADPSNLIVKKASVQVSSRKPAARADQIGALVREHNGIVESFTSANDEHYEYVIRLPEEAVEPFLKEIRSWRERTTESQTTENLTADYADLKVKRDGAIVARDKMRWLINTTDNIDHVLSVTDRMSALQSEAELAGERMQLIENQASMPTLTVTLDQATVLGPVGAIAAIPVLLVKKLFIVKPDFLISKPVYIDDH